jgi:glycosyltransferase involved in cell wall biosynthesis
MIVTINRKEEILRALHSCVECLLPPNTEFIIVDNASQDGTRGAVEHFFENIKYEYSYYYLPHNIGGAAGRNVGLQKARGRYIYYLDDDAYIQGPKENFFQDMINALTENEDIFCITTSIFDTKLNCSRTSINSKKKYSTMFHKVLMFHGGSFLIDKERIIDQNIFFHDYQIRGMAELYPSLKHYFNSQYIFEMEGKKVIHEPSGNQLFSKKMQIIFHYTGSVHVKLTFYPIITYPIVYMMFCLRIIKHLGLMALPEALTQLLKINEYLKRETVPISAFRNLLSEFGFFATF